MGVFALRPVVLVVDDGAANRELIRMYLSTIDCEVRLAADGVAALEMIEREPPDLVLLELASRHVFWAYAWDCRRTRWTRCTAVASSMTLGRSGSPTRSSTSRDHWIRSRFPRCRHMSPSARASSSLCSRHRVCCRSSATITSASTAADIQTGCVHARSRALPS